MTISIEKELLPGVPLLHCPEFSDERGSFRKYFNADDFSAIGAVFQPQEQFISWSKLDVIRGMHYQTGKSAHAKLVYCLKGKVLDVFADINPNSEQFNRPSSIVLEEDKPYALLIGKGYAHGFLSLAEGSAMHYSTTTVHDPAHDTGVLWSSIDFDWPCINPIVSTRDRTHPTIDSLK